MTVRRLVDPIFARALTALVVFAATLSAGGGVAGAHAPHDDIFAVSVSPDFATDGVVYAVSRDYLLRSGDGGETWIRAVRGVDNRSSFSAVDVAPTDANIVVAGTRLGEIFISTDAGTTWSEPAERVEPAVLQVLISPFDANIIFALLEEGVALVSTDQGTTWSPLDPGASVSAIGFDPSDGTTFAGGADGIVWASSDDGATWSEGERFDGTPITELLVATTAAGPTLLVGTDGSGVIAVPRDGGEWRLLNDGLVGDVITGFGIVPIEGIATVVVVERDGGPRRLQNGVTWIAVDDGLTTDIQNESATFSDRPDFSQIDGGGDTAFLGGFDGLFRRTGADPWEEIETLPAGLIVGLDVIADDGEVEVLVTTYLDGVRRSTDGSSFSRVDEGLAVGRPFGSDNGEVARLFGVRYSPDASSGGEAFTSSWTHVFRTEDGGRSWIAEDVVGRTPDPAFPRLYVVAVSPDFANDRTVMAGTRQGELYRSTDGGDTFESFADVGFRIRSLVFSPAFADDRTMLIGGAGGVLVSTDAGASWQPTNLTTMSVMALSPEFGSDRTAFAATRGGLFRSVDGGMTWARAEDPMVSRGRYVEAIAVSPDFADDGVLLVSLRGEGLFRSTDGGKTFAATGPSLIADDAVIGEYSNESTVALRFSPAFAEDGTVYGYSWTRLFRSTDRGETWSEVADFASSPSESGSGNSIAVPSESGSGNSIAVPSESGSGNSIAVPLAIGTAVVVLVGVAVFVRSRRSADAPTRS